MRPLALAICLGLLAASPALSETVADVLTRQLRDQGYLRVEATYTWLGRLRVIARRGDLRREIVINPNTGEILRDYQEHIPSIARNDGAETGGQGSVGVAADVTTRDVVEKGGVSVPDIVDTADIPDEKAKQ
ncbi:hypothetical protein [Gemmobacter caeruleus]|uniref:hypothetical protein n=1 Tax=Gemmobacter caeruleus TaxID=2595004 RepID=UPI0011EBF7D4|nr:hypothetical protein [Gemmobacter caeruleus]